MLNYFILLLFILVLLGPLILLMIFLTKSLNTNIGKTNVAFAYICNTIIVYEGASIIALTEDKSIAQQIMQHYSKIHVGWTRIYITHSDYIKVVNEIAQVYPKSSISTFTSNNNGTTYLSGFLIY